MESRFNQHINTANNEHIKYPLYKAMRKYGIENFTVEEIEKIDDKEELNKREKYWINYYDTYIKNGKGYNCTLGGEGNQIIDNHIIYDLWDQGLSIQEIVNITNNDRSSIRKILKQYDNYTIEESEKRGDKIQSKKRFRSINQYDLKGNYINSFSNMKEAEKQTNISSKLIWAGVNLKQKVAGNYQWRFSDDTQNIVADLSNEKIIRQNQPVKQININTNDVINIYASAAEASRETGINSVTIRKVCHHKGYTAGGYKWEYC